jgi:hypothetical protein
MEALLIHNKAPLLYVSTAQPLMMALLGGLMELRFLDLPSHAPQKFFQETGGQFAVRSLEAHSINLDLALGGDDDFDGSLGVDVHSSGLDDEFDFPVGFVVPGDEMALLPGLLHRFVDEVRWPTSDPEHILRCFRSRRTPRKSVNLLSTELRII